MSIEVSYLAGCSKAASYLEKIFRNYLRVAILFTWSLTLSLKKIIKNSLYHMMQGMGKRVKKDLFFS